MLIDTGHGLSLHCVLMSQLCYTLLLKVALVKWTESVGVTLTERDLNSMIIKAPNGQSLHYKVLQIFPFTSERKRMGIIVQVRFKILINQ